MSSTEERERYEKFLAKAEEITSSKENAYSFLLKAGIIDKNGQLSSEYR